MWELWDGMEIVRCMVTNLHTRPQPHPQRRQLPLPEHRPHPANTQTHRVATGGLRVNKTEQKDTSQSITKQVISLPLCLPLSAPQGLC